MNNLKTVLRWIFFLPIGMLTGFVVFIVYTAIGGNFNPIPGSIGEIIDGLLGGALSGLSAAYVSLYIVPSHHKIVAWILVSLIIVSIILTVPYVVSQKDWIYLLITLTQDLGILLICYKVIKQQITFQQT